MITTLTKRKVPWKKQLEELLQGKPFIPMITEETVRYLRGFDDKYIEAVVMAKNMERPRRSKLVQKRQRKQEQQQQQRRGRRERTTMEDVYRSIFECIGKENDRKYFLAVNDGNLRSHIAKNYPMIPIVRLVQSGLRFQKPSGAMQKQVKQQMRDKLSEYSQLTPWERKMLQQLQKKGDNEEEQPVDDGDDDDGTDDSEYDDNASSESADNDDFSCDGSSDGEEYDDDDGHDDDKSEDSEEESHTRKKQRRH